MFSRRRASVLTAALCFAGCTSGESPTFEETSGAGSTEMEETSSGADDDSDDTTGGGDTSDELADSMCDAANSAVTCWDANQALVDIGARCSSGLTPNDGGLPVCACQWEQSIVATSTTECAIQSASGTCSRVTTDRGSEGCASVSGFDECPPSIVLVEKDPPMGSSFEITLGVNTCVPVSSAHGNALTGCTKFFTADDEACACAQTLLENMCLAG